MKNESDKQNELFDKTDDGREDTDAQRDVPEEVSEADQPTDETGEKDNLSDFDRELREVEGVETMRTPEQKAEIIDKIRHPEPKKQGSKLVIAIVALAVLLLAVIGAAVFLYLQQSSAASKARLLQSELDSSVTELAVLQAKQKAVADKDTAENAKAAETNKTKYVTIAELGVRYKVTDTNNDLVYAYATKSSDINIDSVAFSTTELARVVKKEGVVDVYPCGLVGGIASPEITRYKKDITVNGAMVSKVGKKVGDAYYVYAQPQSLCSDTMRDAQTARNAAVKAAFDSLEVIPATEN